MPLDGITLNSVVQELSHSIVGGRVDKIQQPEPDEILITVRSRGLNHKLLISASASNPRIHLSDIPKGSPFAAPMFCMLLRKHLSGGRIIDITQADFERIVKLSIESPNEMGDYSEKCLIVEIMGKHSNIILVDSASGTIMDSARHVSRELSSVREVLPGRAYILPPSQGKVSPVPLDGAFFKSLFRQEEGSKMERRAQQIIYQSYNGISPVMGSEICLRAGVSPDAMQISDAELERLLLVFSELYADIADGRFDCRIYDGEKRDFSAIKLMLYDERPSSEGFASPSVMLETFYRRQDLHHRLAQKTADLRKLVNTHIERCQRKGLIHQESLLETENREQLRHYGELITSYIYAIPEGASFYLAPDFYNEGTEIEIPLDPSLSASENAQSYFKAYNKAKRAFLALKGQMQANAADLAYLDSVLAAISTAEAEEDIAEIRSELAEQGFLKKRPQKSKAPKKSKPLHYRSSDGFDIYVGKNNLQNDDLTLRFAKPTDIWLHTKEIAGSHVIIRSAGQEVPESTITEGAILAAYYSKGRFSSQVPVDYCPRRHVRKPRGAKPGMVIYDTHRTLFVSPPEELDLGALPQTPQTF